MDMAIARPRVTSVAPRATQRTVDLRSCGSSATTAAASRGTPMRSATNGKELAWVSAWVVIDLEGPRQEVDQQGGHAGEEDQGVLAQLAGLDLAQALGAASGQGGDPVDGAVDDADVDDRGGEVGQPLARPADDR